MDRHRLAHAATEMEEHQFERQLFPAPQGLFRLEADVAQRVVVEFPEFRRQLVDGRLVGLRRKGTRLLGDVVEAECLGMARPTTCTTSARSHTTCLRMTGPVARILANSLPPHVDAPFRCDVIAQPRNNGKKNARPHVAPGMDGVATGIGVPCEIVSSCSAGRCRSILLQACLRSKNCSSSVEPFSAAVDDSRSIVVVTASK